MTYASSLILEVSEDLNDQASGDTYARWSKADLLKYLNSGERQIVYFKPTAYVVSKAYQLSEGSLQSLPDGSSNYQDPSSNTLPQAIELVRVLRNMGGDGLTPGRSIFPVRPQDMEELIPERNHSTPELILNQNPDNSDTWWTVNANTSLGSGGGIIAAAVESNHYIYTSYGYVPSETGNIYKIAAKIKPGDKNWAKLAIAQTDENGIFLATSGVFFDLSTPDVGTASGDDTPYPEGRIITVDSNGYVHCEAIFTIVEYENKTSYAQCLVMAAETGNSQSFTGDGSTVNIYVKNISFKDITIQNSMFYQEKRTSFEVYPPVPPFGEVWIEAQYSAVPPEIEASEGSYDVDINLGDEYREPLKSYMKYRAHAKDAASSMYAKQESVAYWNLFLSQIGRKDLIEKQYRGNYGNRNQ